MATVFPGPGATTASRVAYWLVLGGIAATGVVFIWTDHREHAFGIVPYLVLLLCPAMHWFLHGRHGGHHPAHRGRKG